MLRSDHRVGNDWAGAGGAASTLTSELSEMRIEVAVGAWGTECRTRSLVASW